jgi:uncharacterized protein (TIGR03437 family)
MPVCGAKIEARVRFPLEESTMLRGPVFGLLSSLSLFAQSSAIVGAGYLPPAPVSAAPGQILTVFVSGLGITAPAHAGAGALPISLDGVTATLRQVADLAVPIVDVRPVSTCPDLANIPGQAACATLTAVTLQIPYELVTLCPLCLRPTLLPAQLFVSANGQNSAPFELNALADQIHVLTACDLLLVPFASTPQLNTTGLGCTPIVTHSDGSMVSTSKPANVGETITAWVVGLGQTNPGASTGQPATNAAPTLQTFSLDFNYTVNALAAKPFTGRPDVKPRQPLFAGLAPGYPGLYQINFVVPQDPLNGTPRCSPSGAFDQGGNVVQSNLTVSFGGGFSFDGAGICVATQIPVD